MKREYRLTRQKGIRLLRALHHPHQKSHARLYAMAFASALSCMVMASTTFSTSALAAAKEKIETFDTSSISEFVQAGAQGLQSGADTLIQDAKQLSALSEEAAPVVNDDAIVVQDGQVIIKGDTTATKIRVTMRGTGKDATEVLFKNQITITTDQTTGAGTFTSTALQQVKADPGVKVSFAAASGASTPSLGYFFYGCTNLESLDGLSAWDVSNVTGESCMSNMFSGCTNLASLGALSAWDVSNVKGESCMSSMFSDCTNLASLDGLSAWNVSNVTGNSCMSNMFYKCSSLASLDGLSAWDVSKVTGSHCMSYMFSGCSVLASLDGLSAWDVSKVKGSSCMRSMFSGCSVLASLDGLSAWNVSNMTGTSCMRSMFEACSSLTSLDGLSAWNVSNMTEAECMYAMFYNCSGLTSLDGLSAWNVSNVTGASCMQSMFEACSSLISLDGLSAWDVSNVTGESCMQFMFRNCRNLTSIDALADWKITGALSSPSGVFYMFYNCSDIASITLGGKDGFKLSSDMLLSYAIWWPVDNLTATAGISTSVLLTESQKDNPQSMRWQRTRSTSSNPMTTVTTLQVEWPETNLAYTGLFQTITPTSVKINGTATSLTPGTDFYVSYTKGTTTTDAMKDAGTYTATVNLRGAYKGNPATKQITIAKLNLAQAEVFTEPSECPYTGLPVTPKTMVRVNVGSAASPRYTYLIENTTGRPDGDYTVTYANNENPGIATAKVKYATPAGLADSNLEGTASADFEIVSPQGAYMAYNSTTKTLTLTYGQAPSTGTEGTDWWQVESSYSAENLPGWSAAGASSLSATSVVIDQSVANDAFKPTSVAYWFYNLGDLSSVSGLSNLKGGQITSVAHMYEGCKNLSNPALPDSVSADTLTDFTALFKGCVKQTTSGLPANFTVSAADTLTSLYEGCSTLETLDLTGFTTTATTSMANMFKGTNLTKVIVPKTFQFATGSEFDFTASATTNFWIADIQTKMGDMDGWNSYLQALSDSTPHTFTRANITLTFEAQDGQFGSSTSAQKQAFLYGNANAAIAEAELPVPSRDGYGFAGYAATATGDVIEITAFPAINTSYYAIYSQAAWMLYNGSDELTLSFGAKPTPGTGGSVWQVADDYSASNRPGWTDYEVTKVTIDDSVKNGYKPKSMAYWFSNMPAATAKIVNLASLDTSAVTTMEGTFAGFAKNATSALTAPDLSKFNTQNVSNMASMFKGCSAFETLNISSFNTQNTENFSEMFAEATRLTTLDTSKLVSPKAQTMASMFEGDAALETLDLSALTAPTILTTTASMFSGCSSLSTLNLAGLALGSTVTTTDMFKNCTALTEITLAKNFVFGTATGFAFAGTAPTNFWIADINTKMGTTAATWNTYLAALTANATSHTFTLATSTYTLDANGGLFGTSDAATETLSYYGNEGGALGTIATPTRTGWIQNNWWTAATGGSQVTIPSIFPAAASTTVYAHWNRDSNYAEVSFNTNGATQTLAPVYVQKGTAVTEPTQTLTRENAAFVFWSEDTGLQTPYNFATAVTQDMTLYARWAGTDAANTVAIIFNSNGGSFVQTQIVTRGESATRPANPTRDGATFDTWCEDTGLTEPYAFGPVQEETTIYARWSAANPETTAIVTFNPNGGSFVVSQVVVKGSAATRPANPTLANAKFDTWCQETALEDPFDFASPITGDTTLYARWTAQNPSAYSVVNFNTQGGSFVNSQVVANGSRATRPATIPTKEHYIFDDWYANADATNLWDFNSTIQEATTIYAGWTPVSYTITFNANGLTFQDGTAIKTEAVSYQDEIQAPELIIPADVEFTGWFTEPTGGEPMPDTCSGDATYYAHYTMVPPGPTPPGPSPEPTPGAGGDLVPITGDTLFAFSWMFLAVLAGGIALTAVRILRRKRSL